MKEIYRIWVQWLTDFGDQAVVLPAGLAILLVLLLFHCWRGAVCWIVALGGVLAIMLVLKLFAGACGWMLGIPALNSPSGHTASATVLYGGLVTLLLPDLGIAGCIAISCLIAAVFATSRLVLHDHTPIEVVIGGIVGLGGVLFLRLAGGPAPPRPGRLVLLGLVTIVALVCHGTRLQAERDVHSFAITRLRAVICPLPPDAGAHPRFSAWSAGDAPPASPDAS